MGEREKKKKRKKMHAGWFLLEIGHGGFDTCLCDKAKLDLSFTFSRREPKKRKANARDIRLAKDWADYEDSATCKVRHGRVV